MKTFRRILGLLLLAAVASSALARSSVPIVNYDHVAIPAKPGRTLQDVQRAIALGGANAPGHWSASDSAPGRMRLTLSTRSHVAVVEIVFDVQSYSLRYADSTNLHYEKHGSEELIHPHYNGWVQRLKASIDKQLL